MTPAQLQTLRDHINATPALLALYNAGDRAGLADAYNAEASPAWYGKKTALSRHDIITGASDDGTTFTWAGAAYIGRTQGERDAFREMFNSTGTVNPSLPSIAAAFSDIFSGAGGQTNREHINAMGRRKLNRVEKLFSTGLGTKANPATVTFEGSVTPELFIDV